MRKMPNTQQYFHVYTALPLSPGSHPSQYKLKMCSMLLHKMSKVMRAYHGCRVRSLTNQPIGTPHDISNHSMFS